MEDEKNVEEAKPETNQEEVHVHKAEDKAPVDASGRQRDDKGHFLPNPNGKKKLRSNKDSLKKEIEDNTVKIKIVKEEKPLPPKDFEGKLEDAKERTAIGFIRSIIANKPKRIEVDGITYYSGDVVDKFRTSLNKELKIKNESIKIIKSANEALELADIALEESNEEIHRLRRIISTFSCISTVIIIGLILMIVIPSVCNFSNKELCKDSASQIEQIPAVPAIGQ